MENTPPTFLETLGNNRVNQLPTYEGKVQQIENLVDKVDSLPTTDRREVFGQINELVTQFRDVLYATRVFVDNGGIVVMLILAVTFLLWLIIIERYLYIYTRHPQRLRMATKAWDARPDRHSWWAQKVRLKAISEVIAALNGPIPLIKAIVTVAPLLGLVGTVTGMISVFDAMKIAGSSNGKIIAAGISKATIPTMAGMMAALSGLYIGARLESRVVSEERRMKRLLKIAEKG